MTWPGVVLMVLLGALLGAVAAFFRARVVREVFVYVALGVIGFVVGQGARRILPVHLVDIGIVNIEAGILGALALFLAYPYSKRFRRRSRRRRR